MYVATLAPGVTFWDAGEFIAAAHALGIPHPPGTPLFIILLHVWAWVWSPVLSYAAATNLFSAACTAGAAGAAVWLLASRHSAVKPTAALGAGLCAGAMSTVWLNATETEVYAAALLLALCTLVTAERARRESGFGWLALTAYLVALAVPLHLSALVATPAAMALVAQREDSVDWDRPMLLAGVWIATAGVGRMSAPLIVFGCVTCLGAAWVMAPRVGNAVAAKTAGGVLVALAVGVSAVAFMLWRARFDPAINQGNPITWHALADVIARRQYDVQGLWPREAPVWLQLANVGQYADWQVGLSLGPSVLPSVGRTAATLLFLGLGAYGTVRHRLDDRRTWRALLVLFICGTLGVATYLNLRAGPSLGAGVLPAWAQHEARERDYFFTLGFWAWGLWAGYGAVCLTARMRVSVWAGVALAALPVALNWAAVSRRAEPEADLPGAWARALLDATPRDGVFIAAGDNDTYPLWYAQQALGYRRDVTVVTLPLLPAAWYREELVRRNSLLPTDAAGLRGDLGDTGRLIVRMALARGRSVAVSVYVDAPTRRALGRRWRANGLTFVLVPPGTETDTSRWQPDTATARVLANEAAAVSRPVRASTDPVAAYFQSLMSCPAYVLARAAGKQDTSLDSLCNFR